MSEDLSLYIHIPFCVKKCDYCDFLSAPAGPEVHKRYVRALRHEIEFYGKEYGRSGLKARPAIRTIYIGGGTPSSIGPQYIAEIMETVYRCFDVAEDAEISIECNPGTVTIHGTEIYKKCGINRISFGLQSALDEELENLGRIHTYNDFLESYQIARNAGFSNINIDIMTGLPYQNVDRIKKTLSRVVRLKPEHISCYSLIIEEGTPFYEKYAYEDELRKKGEKTYLLPDEDTEYEIYQFSRRYLIEHGYGQYEFSNYARAGRECRHNIVYWKRGQYLGLGLGAASLLNEDSTDFRTTNTKDLEEYLAAWEYRESISKLEKFPLAEARALSKKECMEEFMFLGLRMNEGVSRADFYDIFGRDMTDVYGPVIDRQKELGNILERDNMVSLSERGQEISNVVLAEFLLD